MKDYNDKGHRPAPPSKEDKRKEPQAGCYKKDSIAKTKWDNLASNTNVRPYKEWYEYSDITTGTTMPPYSAEVDLSKQVNFVNSNITAPKIGSTSFPARAVQNFNAKQQLTLFPQNRSFFVYDIPVAKKQEINQAQATYTASTEVAQEWTMEFLTKEKRLYDTLPNLFDSLTVTGNGLIFMGHKKEDKAVFISPGDYVVRRTDSGFVRELIIREVIAYIDMDDKLKKAVMENRNVSEETFSNDANYNVTEPESVQKFTYVIFEPSGACKYAEYVEETMVQDFKSIPKEEPRFLIIAPVLPTKAQYGIGLVQHMMPSILQMQSGGKAMAVVNNLIGEAKFYAKPSMVNAIRASQQGESGQYLVVSDPNDIGMMQWSNINTAPAEKGMEIAKQEIAKAFIMTSDAVRDAERVTTVEIRRLADDITAVHNNWLAAIAIQLQEPAVRYANYHMNLKNREGKDVRDALQELDVRVVTGTDAIDKVSQSDNLIAVFQEMAAFSSLPPEEKNLFNSTNVASSLVKARGLSTNEFLKSEEQLAQEQEAQQQALLAQQGQQAQIQQLGQRQTTE